MELRSKETISDEDIKLAKDTIPYIFNLNFDLLPFYEDMKNDKIMSKLTQIFIGLKNPTTTTVFESLVDSIINNKFL